MGYSVVVPGKIDPQAKLPVVFWIHGGGCVFSIRSGRYRLKPRHRYAVFSSSGFSGADLVHDALYGAIAVVIQYRLGVFGS